MPFQESAIGTRSTITERTWDSKDAILYAIGVGAGAEDSARELEYTTENSEGFSQRVLPSFSVVLAAHPEANPLALAGTFDMHNLVHGEQAFEVHREIPPEGFVALSATVDGIYDKGSAALVVGSVTGIDAAGEPLFTTRGSYFVRNERGFGKQPRPETPWELPSGPPDVVVDQQTRQDQPLIYRLSGDRNRLHSDPHFARQAGFPRPILHGLCSYGFVARALGQGFAGGQHSQVKAMSVRFTRPVFPGTKLRTEAWAVGSDIRFRVLDSEGEVVLDQGEARIEGLG